MTDPTTTIIPRYAAVAHAAECRRRRDAAEATDPYAGPSLRCANLTGANLTDADLAGADLTRADLTRAVLARADLTDADLAGADLTDADLAGADLTGANLTGAVLPDGVPIIPDIDRTILGAIFQPGCALDMGAWHSCDTTHCRAGWAIHLAGEAGAALERRYGASAAGAMIYAASGSHPTPDWHASGDDAIADMRRRAEELSP